MTLFTTEPNEYKARKKAVIRKGIKPNLFSYSETLFGNGHIIYLGENENEY